MYMLLNNGKHPFYHRGDKKQDFINDFNQGLKNFEDEIELLKNKKVDNNLWSENKNKIETAELFKEMTFAGPEIEGVIESLTNYEFDFTLNVIKEQVKYLAEFGNNKVSRPLALKDLVYLYTVLLIFDLNLD